MCSIAKGRIGREFAVAQFIVAGGINVELNRPAACQDPFALSITPRRVLGMTTSAKVINFRSMQVNVGRKKPSVSWQ